MKVLGYKGLTSFWGTIYFMTEDDFKNVRLVKHEMKHVEQMEKEGIFKFLVKYNYYWFKYGYKNNPYEIEAREAENGY